MRMIMFTTSSANNVIGKVLLDSVEYDIQFKDTTDVRAPLVILRSDNLILSNYAFIPDFGRYYFVESIRLYPNRLYHIQLRCDVLETFKEQILQCEGFVNQQRNINSYYDSGFKTEIRKEAEIYKSDVTLPDTTTTVLTTIGG